MKNRLHSFLFTLAACSALLSPAFGQKAEIPDLGLELTLPALEGLESDVTGSDQVRGVWAGDLAGGEFEMTLIALDAEEWGFDEPGTVANEIVDFLRRNDDSFNVDESDYHEGGYGFAEYLSVLGGPILEDGETVGRQYVAAGLSKDHGYAFHATLRPATDGAVKALQAFFKKGIRYGGEVRDPRWSLEEARQRWLADAPPEVHEEFERNLSKKAWIKKSVIRTDHYLVMTNSSGGKLFAKKLEDNYKEIAKIFPFKDSKSMKLMPIFLFQAEEEYFAFCERRGMSASNAQRSAGHAWKDYYATSYRSPNDPTHIHEQVHQLFSNRLFLSGGGSWYQEGVAEYVESSDNDRNVIAREVKRGRHTPLVEFFQLRSLLFSSDEGGSDDTTQAQDHYKQAALLIEFLRESKWGKGKFDSFLTTVGHVNRGDLASCRAAIERVYGVSIEELDQAFQEYCKKR